MRGARVLLESGGKESSNLYRPQNNRERPSKELPGNRALKEESTRKLFAPDLSTNPKKGKAYPPKTTDDDDSSSSESEGTTSSESESTSSVGPSNSTVGTQDIEPFDEEAIDVTTLPIGVGEDDFAETDTREQGQEGDQEGC